MLTEEEHRKPRHPIRVVAERTGLSPTLLRAWERRYGVVEPERSEGGQRLYSDAHVERLLLLRQVTDAGRNISSVADLGDADLLEMHEEDEGARERREEALHESAVPTSVEKAFAAVEALDPDRLEAHLQRELVSLGGERFLEGLVGPLLVQIGQRWRDGGLRPAHEHVAVAVVKRVLGLMLERVRPVDSGRTVVVGTLSGERHELGTLLAAAAASLEGWRPILTGEDLPAEEIALAARTMDADAVGISVVSPDDWSDLQRQARGLLESLPDETALILGGAGASDLARMLADVRVTVAGGLSDFRATLRTLE